jgi:hypothetical protein
LDPRPLGPEPSALPDCATLRSTRGPGKGPSKSRRVAARRALGWWLCRLSSRHSPEVREHNRLEQAAGVEPALSAWGANRLPMTYACKNTQPRAAPRGPRGRTGDSVPPMQSTQVRFSGLHRQALHTLAASRRCAVSWSELRGSNPSRPAWKAGAAPGGLARSKADTRRRRSAMGSSSRVATKGRDAQLEIRTSASLRPYLYRGLAQGRKGSELNAQCLVGTRAFQTRARHRCESAFPCEVVLHIGTPPPSFYRYNLRAASESRTRTTALATPYPTVGPWLQGRRNDERTLASMGGTIAHLHRRRKREDSDLQRPVGRTGLADRRGASHAHRTSMATSRPPHFQSAQ